MTYFGLSCEHCNQWLQYFRVAETSQFRDAASVQTDFGRGATIDGSRAFQRPVKGRGMFVSSRSDD